MKGEKAEEEPSYEEGRLVGISQADRTRISIYLRNLEEGKKEKQSEEFMDVAKEKLVGAYEATSKFTSKAYEKVGDL